jgi:hypothetical protein
MGSVVKFYLAHEVRLVEGRDLKQLRTSIGSNSCPLRSSPIDLVVEDGILKKTKKATH